MPNDRDTVSVHNPDREPGRGRHGPVHFGGCDDNRSNRLPVMDGWGYIERLYRTRLLDGT